MTLAVRSIKKHFVRALLVTMVVGLMTACGGGGGGGDGANGGGVTNGGGGSGSGSAGGGSGSLLSPVGITSQPVGQTVVAGSSATFYASATGDNLTYQWQLSTDGGSTFADITGATGASYTTSVTSLGESGKRYQVKVSNSQGFVLSSVATLTVIRPAPNLSTFAGHVAGGPGNLDATGPAAGFHSPNGVATDSAGNVYVADAYNQTIRKITPAGVVRTMAGTAGVRGSANGSGAAASFSDPTGVATDSLGNVYVADSGNHMIRKITPVGMVSTLAGSVGVPGASDGSGAAASFYGPSSVATDSAGNVYVADTYNHTIRKITPAGMVSTLAGSAGARGAADGSGAAARFDYPNGVATDSAGNVYVADMFNHTIRKITPAGMVSSLAGAAGVQGAADGSGPAARFDYPNGVATDSAGNVYVADVFNHTIRKITQAGMVSTLAGAAGVRGGATDGSGPAARFYYPASVATDRAGNVYVADSGNDMIRKITPAGMVSTLAGSAGVHGSADGSGAAASFYDPVGVATDIAGNVYVADMSNHTIRKITQAGMVSTLAGSAGVRGAADGSGAEARFYNPAGVATDSAGNVYVADMSNHTIRKITPAGVVSTLAGSAGVRGAADGSGAAARFDYPAGVATDSLGNVYVADNGNHTIRKITPEGMVSTLAGSAGVQGAADGNGTAASFNDPIGVATDNARNVYVADNGNHTIRKITPEGMVSTLAGSAGVWGAVDGSGAAASFSFPAGVATDSVGNVYVADSSSFTIRKITPAGVVTTVVGSPGKAGFIGGVLPGSIAAPQGLAISGTSLYIAANQGVAVVTNVP